MTIISDDPNDNTTHAVPISLHTFTAVLWRDVFVAAREIIPFLAQAILQPLFTLFILGTVLANLGFIDGSYSSILLPGIVALNAFFGALQNTTLPLVLDFSWTREIEDRLLAPMPTSWVAVEKIVFGTLQGIVSALLIIPIGFLVLNGVSWPVSAWPGVLGIIALTSLAGASIGMSIGTLVDARRINILFTVILTPLLFTGSTQFPWLSLSSMSWFQVICSLNPLTYASEGLRDILVADVRSIPLWIDIVVLLTTFVVFGSIGIRGFLRRAVD